jgi:hypothetical protein
MISVLLGTTGAGASFFVATTTGMGGAETTAGIGGLFLTVGSSFTGSLLFSQPAYSARSIDEIRLNNKRIWLK